METNNTIAGLAKECNQLKRRLKIVMNKQLRLENEVQKLKETVLDIQTRQMRENLIRNLPEKRGENLFKEVLGSFIHNFHIPEHYLCSCRNPTELHQGGCSAHNEHRMTGQLESKESSKNHH